MIAVLVLVVELVAELMSGAEWREGTAEGTAMLEATEILQGKRQAGDMTTSVKVASALGLGQMCARLRWWHEFGVVVVGIVVPELGVCREIACTVVGVPCPWCAWLPRVVWVSFSPSVAAHLSCVHSVAE